MLPSEPGHALQKLLIYDGSLNPTDSCWVSQCSSCAWNRNIPADCARRNSIAGDRERRKSGAAHASQANFCGQVFAEDGPVFDELAAHLRVTELAHQRRTKHMCVGP